MYLPLWIDLLYIPLLPCVDSFPDTGWEECTERCKHRMSGTPKYQNNTAARSDSPPSFGYRTIIAYTQDRHTVLGYNLFLKIPQISTLPISYFHCLLRQSSLPSSPLLFIELETVINIIHSIKPWKSSEECIYNHCHLGTDRERPFFHTW